MRRTRFQPKLGSEDFCGSLTEKDASRRGIAGCYSGHDGSVGNTQLFIPIDFEVTIDHRHGIASHPSGTGLMAQAGAFQGVVLK
jgi:hypothetical protein